MLYCNCHYRYKDRFCKFIGYVPETHNGGKKVRIRFQDGSEIECLEKDLEEIPLTESILQSCYRMKTIIRDGEWDVLWDLGGKNNVTVGEKQKQFYLVPFENIEIVTEVLPRGFVQSHNITGLIKPYILTNLSELERIFPEASTYFVR